MAAKNDPYTITILISLDGDWYKNLNSYIGPFPDTHVIVHFAADTITYEEPTIPPELNSIKNITKYSTNILHPPPKQQHWYIRANEATHIYNR